MKKYALLILFSALMLNVKAQSKEEQQLVEAVEKVRLAMMSGNAADLERVAADNLSYWHSHGKLENKAQFVQSISTGKSDFVDIKFTDQTISISGNTALVHHVLSGTTNDNNKPGNVNIGVLLVFQKIKGEWKLFGRQAYPNAEPKKTTI